jgi:hypothetical protein
MVDLTSELRQMADDAACRARPLAVAEVIRRGDRRHRRSIARRSLGGLSATGVIAAAIIGVIALPPASHQASHRVHAQLAAWTVVRQADGTIFVQIRELRDPAGLQATLRADGVPASVAFYPGSVAPGQSPISIVQFKDNPCEEYSGGEDQAQNVVTGQDPFQSGFTVHPSAIPSGAGVQIVASSNVAYNPQQQPGKALFEWLVQASPQCTGS